MTELTLVLGGTRSGKSALAERHAAEAAGAGSQVLYIATCRTGDPELVERVRIHRDRRPPSWTTIEEPMDPARALGRLKSGPRACLVDCLSFLVFNWMSDGRDDDEVMTGVSQLYAAMRAADGRFIVVSNDVSGSFIPPDPISRRYQDLLGKVNQIAANESDRVYLAVAGLPITLKS